MSSRIFLGPCFSNLNSKFLNYALSNILILSTGLRLKNSTQMLVCIEIKKLALKDSLYQNKMSLILI